MQPKSDNKAPDLMKSVSDRSVILFDGHCNLCNGWVKWVIKRDRQGLYRFASLQSDFGQDVMARHGKVALDLDSVALLTADGQLYTHSTAALRITEGLGGVYRLAAGLRAFPRPLRDWVYNWIARNRYRWFGKAESCYLPRPEWRDRFVGN